MRIPAEATERVLELRKKEIAREVKKDNVQEQILEKLTLISEQLAEVIKLLKAK